MSSVRWSERLGRWNQKVVEVMTNYRTWIEISRSAIRWNVKNIKARVSKKSLFLVVVKGNAWGCGTLEYAKTSIEAGADWLGVTTIEDALLLRENGITEPILILCEIPLARLKEAIMRHFRLTVCTKYTAKAVSDLAVEAKSVVNVHIKVNTGLNRIGVPLESAVDFILYVAKLPNLKIEGAFTHFSSADRGEDDLTRQQLEDFLLELNRVKCLGIEIPILHAANTPATLALPETHLCMVRVGMGIAGLYPSKQFRQTIELHFPMTWKSNISFLRSVSAGERIGYGGRYKCNRNTTIATISVGTADGLSKRYEANGFVLIKGYKCKIAAISMDQAMVDTGGNLETDLRLYDEVVIIGKQGNDYIDPMIVADEIGADVEELLCQISYRVPRVYVS
jgi:alanine racemase